MADEIGVATADELVIRSEPGTHAGSVMLDHRLHDGDQFFVVDGPVSASGYWWYLIQPLEPPAASPESPADATWMPRPFGWLAAASREGDPWVVPMEVDCNPGHLPLPDRLLAMAPEERLACFGSQELAWTSAMEYTGCGAIGGYSGPVIEPTWLSHVGGGAMFNRGVIPTQGGYDLILHFAPESGYEGGSLCGQGTQGGQVSGHFDGARASSCEYRDQVIEGIDDPGDDPMSRQVILHCRMQFAVTGLEPVR